MPLMAPTYRPRFYLSYSKAAVVDNNVCTQSRMQPLAIEFSGGCFCFFTIGGSESNSDLGSTGPGVKRGSLQNG